MCLFWSSSDTVTPFSFLFGACNAPNSCKNIFAKYYPLYRPTLREIQCNSFLFHSLFADPCQKHKMRPSLSLDQCWCHNFFYLSIDPWQQTISQCVSNTQTEPLATNSLYFCLCFLYLPPPLRWSKLKDTKCVLSLVQFSGQNVNAILNKHKILNLIKMSRWFFYIQSLISSLNRSWHAHKLLVPLK